MSAFDLTKFNNINNMLTLKNNNAPRLDYDAETNTSYTTWRLAQYYKVTEHYGPDYVEITYTYWHNEPRYDENKNTFDCCCSPIVVLGHDYDKDIQPNWNDAASYHKYDRDCDSD